MGCAAACLLHAAQPAHGTPALMERATTGQTTASRTMRHAPLRTPCNPQCVQHALQSFANAAAHHWRNTQYLNTKHHQRVRCKRGRSSRTMRRRRPFYREEIAGPCAFCSPFCSTMRSPHLLSFLLSFLVSQHGGTPKGLLITEDATGARSTLTIADRISGGIALYFATFVFIAATIAVVAFPILTVVSADCANVATVTTILSTTTYAFIVVPIATITIIKHAPPLHTPPPLPHDALPATAAHPRTTEASGVPPPPFLRPQWRRRQRRQQCRLAPPPLPQLLP